MPLSHNTISGRIAQLHERMSAEHSDEMLQTFQLERARMRAGGIPPSASAIGDVIPDVRLLDVYGNTTMLSDAQKERPAVVVLYRGAWCPYCNLTLRTYQEDLLPTLNKRMIELIAISPQRPDRSLSTQEKEGLTFTVLSDPGNQVATALGVLTQHSAAIQHVQCTLGFDVSEFNQDGTHSVPMPTVALIDPTRTIQWIDIRADYATRTEVAVITSALETYDPR
ncbi:peroxiredoxin-like family protein [Mycolicibacterium smegmatis]|uniref:thioredoxin-dependent peroxiredoxin n=1 Tax=Mycolicibacterium smegmatis (strain MKD8) TaxID=1214915 RepID=A0A2U9PKC2_MYCSE|nr:peroxiredoxin-like family protein [Mycolicibacterium smegmatis]AWT52182.1 antioxidant, AhpC/TSA family protein [Mycolicibacterium smegmatis MKD8]